MNQEAKTLYDSYSKEEIAEYMLILIEVIREKNKIISQGKIK